MFVRSRIGPINGGGFNQLSSESHKREFNPARQTGGAFSKKISTGGERNTLYPKHEIQVILFLVDQITGPTVIWK